MTVDISIVITSYNYANHVVECVRSCLDQQATAVSHEVIVIDDGSTDDTPAILDGISDPRLNKFRIDNSGIEAASNYGFAKSCGRYIVRVDADDKLKSNYLHDMAANLDEEYGYFYPNYDVINSDGKITESVMLPDFDENEIINRGDFLATGTLYRASVIEAVGGYSTLEKNSGLENYELIITLLKMGIRGLHVPQSLFYYRRHASNISITKQEGIIMNGYSLFARNGLGSFRTNNNHPYKLKLK
jgi:glycosyltransferase involved in cell wall biosynthesis